MGKTVTKWLNSLLIVTQERNVVFLIQAMYLSYSLPAYSASYGEPRGLESCVLQKAQGKRSGPLWQVHGPTHSLQSWGCARPSATLKFTFKLIFLTLRSCCRAAIFSVRLKLTISAVRFKRHSQHFITESFALQEVRLPFYMTVEVMAGATGVPSCYGPNE